MTEEIICPIRKNENDKFPTHVEIIIRLRILAIVYSKLSNARKVRDVRNVKGTATIEEILGTVLNGFREGKIVIRMNGKWTKKASP